MLRRLHLSRHHATSAAPPAVVAVGLGNMGSPLSARVAAKFAVAAYDLDASLVAEHCKASGSVAIGDAAQLQSYTATANVLLTCLPNTDATRATLETVRPALQPGLTWIDATSGRAEDAAALADELWERHGVRFLDCAVSGGPRGAAQGILAAVCPSAASNAALTMAARHTAPHAFGAGVGAAGGRRQAGLRGRGGRDRMLCGQGGAPPTGVGPASVASRPTSPPSVVRLAPGDAPRPRGLRPPGQEHQQRAARRQPAQRLRGRRRHRAVRHRRALGPAGDRLFRSPTHHDCSVHPRPARSAASSFHHTRTRRRRSTARPAARG